MSTKYWEQFSVARSAVRPTGDQGFMYSVRRHSVVEIDSEIFTMTILSFPLIQEWQLSVFGK